MSGDAFPSERFERRRIVILTTNEAVRGAYGSGDHGEFSILEKSAFTQDTSASTIFVTLEPCAKRKSHHKIPCAERIRALSGAVSQNIRGKAQFEKQL